MRTIYHDTHVFMVKNYQSTSSQQAMSKGPQIVARHDIREQSGSSRYQKNLQHQRNPSEVARDLLTPCANRQESREDLLSRDCSECHLLLSTPRSDDSSIIAPFYNSSHINHSQDDKVRKRRNFQDTMKATPRDRQQNMSSMYF